MPYTKYSSDSYDNRKKISSIIEQYFKTDDAPILVIDGERQVGKSFIIHDATYYKKYKLPDDYRKFPGMIVQHLTVEKCITENDEDAIDSIMNVLNAAGEAAKQAGKPAPVVILDYLHLITTDKREEQAEILKKAVAALKGYAIQYDTFVFAISANNRAANTSGIVSLDSGRDTSAIEYSADIQLSLNYAALADRRKKDNGEYYKASNPDDMAELQRGDANGNREMLVQVLKNRMNAPGGKLYMSFNPAASVFYPVDKYATPPAYYRGFTPIDDEDPDNPFTAPKMTI